MRMSVLLTPLVVAAAIAVAAPASSSARPIDQVPAAAAVERCYQLNPVVPDEARGRHQVPCGPTGTAATNSGPVAVSEVRPASSGGISWDAVAVGFAVVGLVLSAAALLGRRSYRRRVAV
jgi:hypothetical protein